MKKILMFIFIFSLIQIAFSKERTFVITASKVNVRLEPNIDSKTISQLDYNQEIEVIEKTENKYKIGGFPSSWTKIKTKEIEGYILDYYIYSLPKNEKLPPLFLTLKLLNGKSIQLQNKPYRFEETKVYNLLTYNKQIGFYIVRENRWEGCSTFLFSDKDGTKYEIIGEPIVSPNKKQLLSLSIDLWAGYNVSGIEIYSIEKNIPVIKFRKIHESKDNLNWGAKNGKWISDNEIEYTKETLSGNGVKQEFIIRMKFQNDKWIGL